MEPDFFRLYSLLDLAPACTAEELKRAYRRRVARLHPDRNPGHGIREGETTLSELVALYGQAMRFHRLHGRLPGEVVARPPRLAAGVTPAAPGPEPPPRPARTAKATRPVASRTPPRLVWLALLLAAVAVYLMLSSAGVVLPDPAPASPRPGASATGNVDTGSLPARLVPGMDMPTVLEIQGMPTRQGATLWEYGPSWVLFHEGRLVDWYSSPLYRLKVATPVANAPAPGA